MHSFGDQSEKRFQLPHGDSVSLHLLHPWLTESSSQSLMIGYQRSLPLQILPWVSRISWDISVCFMIEMPQWVQLPPNLVPEKHTIGKSIYSTDYSSKRPGFQLHLLKARGFRGSGYHPPVPKVWRLCFVFYEFWNALNGSSELLAVLTRPRIIL